MRFILAGLLATSLFAPVLSAESVAVRSGAGGAPTLFDAERLLTAPVEKNGETDWRTLAPGERAAAGSLITLLPNSGFEAGAVIWIEASLNGWPLILDSSALPVGVAPHGGSWAAWLGGDQNEIAYIAQQVTVPLGSPVLRYWHWIDSEDDCGWDFAGVIVDFSTVVQTYDLCWPNDTGGWALHSVDMAAYAGQTVSLQIRVETDSQLISNLFVDDVFFESDDTLIFGDGFESGDLTVWSSSVP